MNLVLPKLIKTQSSSQKIQESSVLVIAFILTEHPGEYIKFPSHLKDMKE